VRHPVVVVVAAAAAAAYAASCFCLLSILPQCGAQTRRKWRVEISAFKYATFAPKRC